MKIDDKSYGASEVCGATVQTTFSVQRSKLMFDVLSSRIYTDKIGAVVREITSNAIDAGGKAFISLPNYGSPAFSVRDEGEGISPENMATIYTVYFASTKRENNDSIGGFGLGAKTPLAYTDSFSVRSIHKGVLSLYVINRTAEGVPVLHLMHTEPTQQERSGVEISVPVPVADFARWRETVRELCAWQEDRVELVGEAEQISRPYLYRNDRFAYCTLPGQELGVVLGGWFYSVETIHPKNYDRNRPSISNYVEFLAIGSVDITVSRESLESTQRTEEYLARINDTHFAEYVSWLSKHMIDYVDQAGTVVERYARRYEVNRWVNHVDKFAYEHEFVSPLTSYSGCYRRKIRESRRVSTVEAFSQISRHNRGAGGKVYLADCKINKKVTPQDHFFTAANTPESLKFLAEVGVVLSGKLSEFQDKAKVACTRSRGKITLYKALGGSFADCVYLNNTDNFPSAQIYVVVTRKSIPGAAARVARAVNTAVGVSKGSLAKIPATWVEAVAWVNQQISEVASDRLLLLVEAFAVEISGLALLHGLGLRDPEHRELRRSKLGNILAACVTDVLPSIQAEIRKRKLQVIRENISPIALAILTGIKTTTAISEADKKRVSLIIWKTFS